MAVISHRNSRSGWMQAAGRCPPRPNRRRASFGVRGPSFTRRMANHHRHQRPSGASTRPAMGGGVGDAGSGSKNKGAARLAAPGACNHGGSGSALPCGCIRTPGCDCCCARRHGYASRRMLPAAKLGCWRGSPGTLPSALRPDTSTHPKMPCSWLLRGWVGTNLGTVKMQRPSCRLRPMR
jgi:hypothetical protein